MNQEVNRININHEFEKFVNSVFISYRNSVGLSSIGEDQLLSMLLEQKKDKQHDTLKMLINTREQQRFDQKLTRSYYLNQK